MALRLGDCLGFPGQVGAETGAGRVWDLVLCARLGSPPEASLGYGVVSCRVEVVWRLLLYIVKPLAAALCRARLYARFPLRGKLIWAFPRISPCLWLSSWVAQGSLGPSG